jgi:transcriptional regulator with GAF, ATPase, and Fis domain
MTQNDTPQDALSQRIRELELMVQVSRTLTSTLDVERLLKLIITMAAKLVSSEGASIILEDRRQGELVFRAVAGPKSKALVNIHVPIEGSIAGTVFKTQKPLIRTGPTPL